MKIKEANDGVINGKASKTLEAMQMKEELARQELKRVKEAQDKRKAEHQAQAEKAKVRRVESIPVLGSQLSEARLSSRNL